jgi:glutamine amidotransferase
MNLLVIDTETSNLKSIANALSYLGINFSISSNPENIQSATHIILPGVGAFDAVMKKLARNGLDEALKNKIVARDSRILGICLGMQILGEFSDEGDRSVGLGVIPARVIKLPAIPSFKVPHVGLNSVEQISDSELFTGIPDMADFYFVHSYAMEISNINSMVGRTNNGISFCSVIDNKEGVFGVQFHPEKSRMNGLKIIQNFLEIRKC